MWKLVREHKAVADLILSTSHSEALISKEKNNWLFWYCLISLSFCQVSVFTTHCHGVISWRTYCYTHTHTNQPRTSSKLCKKHNSTFFVSLQLKSLDKRQLHLRIMLCLKRMWLVLRWPLPKERLFLGSLAKNPKFPAPNMHCQIANSTNFFLLPKGDLKNWGGGCREEIVFWCLALLDFQVCHPQMTKISSHLNGCIGESSCRSCD